MSAAIKKFPGPAKEAPPAMDDDEDEHECPKCPPVGAPAWLATFADIATNLMAFFVLILGFAQFDEPSFAKMAGSMRETFGTQMIASVMENPSSNRVIELDFQSGEDDKGQDDAEESSSSGEGSTPDNAEAGAAETEARDQGRDAAQALMEALSSGGVTVEQGDSSVTVKLDEAQGQPLAEAIAKALAQAAGTAVQSDTTASAQGGDEQPEPQTDPQGTTEASAGRGGKGGVAKGASHSPGFAAARLSVALQEEIGQGLVTVERRDGKVFITMGEGGGFPSGSADLTDEARALVEQIATTALDPEARITVTGHTDSVPLSASPFTDNLGLGAARAAAVVRELVDSGKIDPAKATATSKGEFAPLADNTTEEGRAKNRRIEIEIDYPAP